MAKRLNLLLLFQCKKRDQRNKVLTYTQPGGEDHRMTAKAFVPGSQPVLRRGECATKIFSTLVAGSCTAECCKCNLTYREQTYLKVDVHRGIGIKVA